MGGFWNEIAALGGLGLLFFGMAAVMEGLFFAGATYLRFLKVLAGVIAAFVGVVFLTGPAAAQERSTMEIACFNPMEGDRALRDEYGETIFAIGELQGGRPAVVYRNEETGTWSVMFMNQSLRLCMVLSGRHFAVVDEKPGEKM